MSYSVYLVNYETPLIVDAEDADEARTRAEEIAPFAEIRAIIANQGAANA